MTEDITKLNRGFKEGWYKIDDVDINNKGLEITFETGDGLKKVGISENKLKAKAKQVGIDPKSIDTIKQLPPEQRKRYAISLLYRLMQDDDFKNAFLEGLKEKGIIYIPETKENITFLNVVKYLIFIAGIGIVLLLITEMMR